VIKIPGFPGGSFLALAGAILLAGVAGCGGSSPKSVGAITANQHSASAYSTVRPTSSSATQGTGESSRDTPQDAVNGLIRAERSGNFSLECSYLAPSSQSTCITGFSQAPQSVPTLTGTATVVGVVISGDEALVEVTGNACTTGNGCQSNSDPSEGMPTGSTTFAQAYNNASNPPANGNNPMSPVPCELINKSWYVGYSD
jgi:hypothetical protein